MTEMIGQLVSDLHLECHSDDGRGIINEIVENGEGADVLILAGDILNLKRREHAHRVLGEFCNKYNDVVYVPGNHEWYGTTYNDGWAALHELSAEWRNLHVLSPEAGVVTIGGKRFLGGTMWFPANLESVNPDLQKMLGDFHHIKNLHKVVFAENAKLDLFLNAELEEGDIVVTHHLPSMRSVHPFFKDSALNCFFVSPMDELIELRAPAVWMHGHSHSHADWYALSGTRVVCNPFGYPNEATANSRFKTDLLLKL
jgi:predicted phosphodiesterase